MATLDCLCSATPLSTDGLQAAMDALNIDAATLWAMVSVETHGCGFFTSRRPKILFERHKFSKHTGGKYDAIASDVSNPIAGGYGEPGDFQYKRLGKAYDLDPDAALMSASWGLGQVMGENFAMVGYASVSDMVAAMVSSEDKQLEAVVGFVKSKKVETALQQQKWAVYAAAYNGSDYAKYNYDTNLNAAYNLFQDVAKRPNLTVRTAQMYLTLLGYDPHGVDGSMGAHSLTALHNFQVAQQQALSTAIDDGVVASLLAALPAAGNLSLA